MSIYLFKEGVECNDMLKIALAIRDIQDLNATHTLLNDHTPLSYVCAKAGVNASAVSILVSAGADTELSSTFRKVPLMVSVMNRRTEITRELISLGANVHMRDKEGMTPLHFACLLGPPEMVEVLISGGANVNAVAKRSITPLQYAIQFDKHKIADLLIAAKAHTINPIT